MTATTLDCAPDARGQDDAEGGSSSPFSGEFLALRDRAHELARAAVDIRLSGESAEAVAAAERAAAGAEEEAWQQLVADRRAARRQAIDDANAERERERLREQEDATIQRIVLALRDRGPMTGGELEALRIEGASHNSLRPLLRRAVEQGLVRRRRDGKRVLWCAVPFGDLYSPEWSHPSDTERQPAGVTRT